MVKLSLGPIRRGTLQQCPSDFRGGRVDPGGFFAWEAASGEKGY